MEDGLYKINEILLIDNQNNKVWIGNSNINNYRDNLEDLSAGDFKVSGTNADVKPPMIEVNSLKVEKSEVKAGDTIKISIKASDDISGIRHFAIIYTAPITGKNVELRMAYNSKTGMYEGSLYIDERMEDGLYKINEMILIDNQNNEVWIGNSNINNYGDNLEDLSLGDFYVQNNGSIGGIVLEGGHGTLANPLVILLQSEKAIDELVSKLESNFEYSIVDDPAIENNYKIYKLKLNNKNIAIKELLKVNNNINYIQIKVDLENTNIINKLDKIFIKVTENKLIGEDRYQTAIKVSNRGWSKSENVVIVNSSAIVDALSATPFAKMKDAPILLTAKDKLNNETKKEITRLGAKNVYIIGGSGVISEDIVSELKAMNLNVDRISGDTRYTTSLAIAKRLGKVSEIAVVNGVTGLADAVSIAPVAAERNIPIILSSPNEGTKVFDEYIKSNNIKTSYIIGGEAAISKDIASKLPNLNRLGGLSRNETNAIILEKFYTNKNLNNIFVAKDGMKKVDDLIDALSVGVLAAKENSPLVIVGNKLDLKQEKLIASKTPKAITQVGGNGNENAFNQIVNMLKK